ncbi:MAG: AzlD domain-containing protein [Oscillospiraceae bacterium]|nr:AzlD domain-containing protein [Oscillospiraceae bacterium]
MPSNIVCILVAFATVYAVRVLPLTLIRRPIQSRFIRSFLRYVPYVTLAVMTFPAIVEATAVPAAGVAALIIGIAVALWKGNLLLVSAVCCAVVFLVEMIF